MPVMPSESIVFRVCKQAVLINERQFEAVIPSVRWKSQFLDFLKFSKGRTSNETISSLAIPAAENFAQK